MTWPPLAIAAATIATCSGVTRTSYWPIADCAVCGGLSWAGTTLGVTGIGTRSDWPKPNLAAWSCSALAPERQAEPSRTRCCRRSAARGSA